MKASAPAVPDRSARTADAKSSGKPGSAKAGTVRADGAKPVPAKPVPAKAAAVRPSAVKAEAEQPAEASAVKPAGAKAATAGAPAAATSAPAKSPVVKPAVAKAAANPAVPAPRDAGATAEAAPAAKPEAPAAAPEPSAAPPSANAASAPGMAPQAPAADNEPEDEEEETEQRFPVPAASRPVGGMGRPMSPMGGRPPQISRAAAKDEVFAEGDHVVYPTHGVGRVDRIATEEIAGHRLELIHITFEENRMTLRVPVAKARSAGLRKLATRTQFEEAMTVLKGRARIKRTMWSRRAQEYEQKINSGDPIAIAEVVRDLHRNAGQPDQSFSERQIYEAAMDRLAAELAALDQTDKPTAAAKLAAFLKTIT
jgi:CarD family transcriptional regulator